MRTRFTALPGVSLRGIGLQTGPIRGIEIDNPSGSWLNIPSIETFIAPYTVGWSYGLPYDASSIDILAQAGPAGKLSTNQGDAVTVYLTDERIAQSQGSPSIGALITDTGGTYLFARGTHILQYGVTQQASTTTAVTGGTKRIRLHSHHISSVVGMGSFSDVAGPAYGTIFPSITNVNDAYSFLECHGKRVHDEVDFVPALDLPIGEELTMLSVLIDRLHLNASGLYGGTSVQLNHLVIYELI